MSLVLTDHCVSSGPVVMSPHTGLLMSGDNWKRDVDALTTGTLLSRVSLLRPGVSAIRPVTSAHTHMTQVGPGWPACSTRWPLLPCVTVSLHLVITMFWYSSDDDNDTANMTNAMQRHPGNYSSCTPRKVLGAMNAVSF